MATLAELALFAVLFTDGMRVGWADLRSAWRLPGRALGWGLPLTLVITAVLAHCVAGLDWPEALLIGAILAPTDPVFAAALVGNDKVPARLRHLLNVESGVNDGLALPFVIVFLAVAGRLRRPAPRRPGPGAAPRPARSASAVPLAAILLERTRFFAASTAYDPLNGGRHRAAGARPRQGDARATCSSPRSPPASPWPPSARGSARRSSTSARTSPNCSSWRRCWCSAR